MAVQGIPRLAGEMSVVIAVRDAAEAAALGAA